MVAALRYLGPTTMVFALNKQEGIGRGSGCKRLLVSLRLTYRGQRVRSERYKVKEREVMQFGDIHEAGLVCPTHAMSSLSRPSTLVVLVGCFRVVWGIWH
jgi:hypothetical protein